MQNLYDNFTVALGRLLTLTREDLRREDGQGATEYGLVIAFAVVVLGVSIGLLGTAITNFLGRVAGKLDALVP